MRLGVVVIGRNEGERLKRCLQSLPDRAKLALFELLARIPESWGQIKFTLDCLLGRPARIIELK